MVAVVAVAVLTAVARSASTTVDCVVAARANPPTMAVAELVVVVMETVVVVAVSRSTMVEAWEGRVSSTNTAVSLVASGAVKAGQTLVFQ